MFVPRLTCSALSSGCFPRQFGSREEADHGELLD